MKFENIVTEKDFLEFVTSSIKEFNDNNKDNKVYLMGAGTIKDNFDYDVPWLYCNDKFLDYLKSKADESLNIIKYNLYKEVEVSGNRRANRYIYYVDNNNNNKSIDDIINAFKENNNESREYFINDGEGTISFNDFFIKNNSIKASDVKDVETYNKYLLQKIKEYNKDKELNQKSFIVSNCPDLSKPYTIVFSNKELLANIFSELRSNPKIKSIDFSESKDNNSIKLLFNGTATIGNYIVDEKCSLDALNYRKIKKNNLKFINFGETAEEAEKYIDKNKNLDNIVGVFDLIKEEIKQYNKTTDQKFYITGRGNNDCLNYIPIVICSKEFKNKIFEQIKKHSNVTDNGHVGFFDGGEAIKLNDSKKIAFAEYQHPREAYDKLSYNERKNINLGEEDLDYAKYLDSITSPEERFIYLLNSFIEDKINNYMCSKDMYADDAYILCSLASKDIQKLKELANKYNIKHSPSGAFNGSTTFYIRHKKFVTTTNLGSIFDTFKDNTISDYYKHEIVFKYDKKDKPEKYSDFVEKNDISIDEITKLLPKNSYFIYDINNNMKYIYCPNEEKNNLISLFRRNEKIKMHDSYNNCLVFKNGFNIKLLSGEFQNPSDFINSNFLIDNNYCIFHNGEAKPLLDKHCELKFTHKQKIYDILYETMNSSKKKKYWISGRGHKNPKNAIAAFTDDKALEQIIKYLNDNSINYRKDKDYYAINIGWNTFYISSDEKYENLLNLKEEKIDSVLAGSDAYGEIDFGEGYIDSTDTLII
ncbi:MAG: hypothetical protein LC122_11725 [Chitinophagales bacterium]|nr:hypothetical protein [Chitinophagales bacterium]